MSSYLESFLEESLLELKEMKNQLSELKVKETLTSGEETIVANLTSNIPIYKEYISRLIQKTKKQ